MQIKGGVNSESLAAFLKVLAEKGIRLESDVAYDAIHEATVMLQNETKMRCPVDEHHLERSIHRRVRRNKASVTGNVFVNLDGPAGEYAKKIHEGTYKLGDLSRAKQNTVPVRVGNKYLERALSENETEYQRIIRRRIERFIRDDS